MHPRPDPLSVPNQWALPPTHLIGHITFSRVPCAGAVQESVAEDDNLNIRERKSVLFDLLIQPGVKDDVRRIVKRERRIFRCEAFAGCIQESD